MVTAVAHLMIRFDDSPTHSRNTHTHAHTHSRTRTHTHTHTLTHATHSLAHAIRSLTQPRTLRKNKKSYFFERLWPQSAIANTCPTGQPWYVGTALVTCILHGTETLEALARKQAEDLELIDNTRMLLYPPLVAVPNTSYPLPKLCR